MFKGTVKEMNHHSNNHKQLLLQHRCTDYCSVQHNKTSMTTVTILKTEHYSNSSITHQTCVCVCDRKREARWQTLAPQNVFHCS